MDAYTVAGKTGTVRKVGEGGYQDTRHMAFFAGITPAVEPRVWSGVVMINEPKGGRLRRRGNRCAGILQIHGRRAQAAERAA